MMMRSRMIEKLGDGQPSFIEARPVQIAQHDPLFRFLLRGLDQTHLRFEILPTLAVVDEAIDPGPKLRVHRIVQLALPPKIKRQIGIKMRENNIWKQTRARTFQPKREL